MEQSRWSPKRRIALGLIAGAVVLGVTWSLVRFFGQAEVGRPTPVSAANRGYVVEVLNGTPRSGLARQVTRLLRDKGVDVVYFGSGDGADSSVVLVRRGDVSRGSEVARLVGIKKVVARPDPKPRVDMTIVVGADFRFPKGWLPL